MCRINIFRTLFFKSLRLSLSIRDKPDLYSEKEDIGIEVVEAVDPKKKEAEKMWYTIPYLTDVEKEKHIKRMNELGFPFMSEVVQGWPGQQYDKGINSDPYVWLFSALEKKLELIKSGKYMECKEYELFIEGEMRPIRECQYQLMEKLSSIIKKMDVKLSRVYLLTQAVLQVFDFASEDYCWIDTSDLYNKLVCEACRRVEETEEQT